MKNLLILSLLLSFSLGFVFDADAMKRRRDNTPEEKQEAKDGNSLKKRRKISVEEKKIDSTKTSSKKFEVSSLLNNGIVEFFSDIFPQLTCSICLDKTSKDDRFECTECEAYFHNNCIDKWLEESYVCPNCRVIYAEKFINHIENHSDKKLAEIINNGKISNINYQNKDGNTLLHITVRKNKRHATEALLKKKINPNKRDKFGETPLLISSLLERPKLTKLLLDYNANPNLKNSDGYTPLQLTLALEINNTKIIEIFKNQNINVTKEDIKKALEIAKQVGRKDLTEQNILEKK